MLRISRRRTRDLILPGNSLKRSPKETLLTYFAEDSRALVLTTLPLLMVLPSLALLAAVLDLVSLTFSSQATVVWERYCLMLLPERCLIVTFSPNFARLYIRWRRPLGVQEHPISSFFGDYCIARTRGYSTYVPLL